MKKMCKLILFLTAIFLIFLTDIKAKDIYDIACNYKLTCYDRDEDTKSKSADFGYMQIQYINIFDRDLNNKLKGTYSVFYSKDGYSSLKKVEPTIVLKELIYKTLNESGITIPFNQLDVHLIDNDK